MSSSSVALALPLQIRRQCSTCFKSLATTEKSYYHLRLFNLENRSYRGSIYGSGSSNSIIYHLITAAPWTWTWTWPCRGMALKAVSRGIKLAYNVAKGFKAFDAVQSLQNPVQGLLLAIFAAKTLAKGATKGLLVKAEEAGSFKIIYKGLKTSEGALNLVRYSTDLHATGWGVLLTGYKLFKSAFNVAEGIDIFAKIQLEDNGLLLAVEKGIKTGLDNVGIVVKAFALAKEMQRILVHKATISKEAFQDMFEDLIILTRFYTNGKKTLVLPSVEEQKPHCLLSKLSHRRFRTFEDRQPPISFLESCFQLHQYESLECLLCLSIPLGGVDYSIYYNSKCPSLIDFVIPCNNSCPLSQKCVERSYP